MSLWPYQIHFECEVTKAEVGFLWVFPVLSHLPVLYNLL